MTVSIHTSSGVNYAKLDPFKLAATAAARLTAKNPERLGFRVLEDTYGESAFLLVLTKMIMFILAHVEEGLGTKNLVADAMEELTGETYYDAIAQDTVAMIVNDLLSLGALPVSVAMHLAVQSGEWFDNAKRNKALIDGWKRACDMARCAWGGGETPELDGIVVPRSSLISGSATGIIRPPERRFAGKRICKGDIIALLSSSGIHANGLTGARRVKEKLRDGYMTRLSDGRTYGETLLRPTHIYVSIVEDALNLGADIHYAVNMTGHGWRKLMRAEESWRYVIDTLPGQLPIFDFLQEHRGLSDKEMYASYNMRAGFALYMPERDVPKLMEALMGKSGEKWAGAVEPNIDIDVTVAGYVEEGPKQVVIRPKNITFIGDELQVR